MRTRPARAISAISRRAPTDILPAQGTILGSGIGSEQAENLLPFLSLFDLGPAVISSDPAQGQVVTTTPPTTFSLTFNEPIVPSSIQAADFTVDGTPADGDYQSPDDTTIYYTFTSSPVINQGLETMELPADSVIGANDGQFQPQSPSPRPSFTSTPSFRLRPPAHRVGSDPSPLPGHRSRRPVQRGD